MSVPPDPAQPSVSLPPLPKTRPVRFRTSRTVGALFIREMSTTYGRSAMGYVWAILEPVAAVMLLSLVFSLALRAPSLGTSFPLFYATGMLPFTGYLDINQKVAQSLRFSKQLLFYPGVTYLDALLARFLLNVLTQIMVVAFVLLGLIQIFDLRVILDLPMIAHGLAMAFWLGAGIGTLNCYLMATYPNWERVWAILTRPLFFISGIFFLFDDIPQPYQDWLWWNPLVHVIGQVRKGVYVTYDAAYVSPGYVWAIGGITLALGLLFLRRYHRDIINN
ncbi:ABC transporter permease [Aestuariibius sp. HNIBRBA575]|uniref:ABC transporter permease n=1 Tax=Aestuariibius sp. HNIBRBA575 TaxID=3233343 RepID=UPI0034A15F4D